MVPDKNIKSLRAFHGDKKLKSDMVKELKWHREQDMIVKGTYGSSGKDNFKGCAVGCSIDSLNRKYGKCISTNDHKSYETELGIPEALAHLEDSIFEGMPNDTATDFPLNFIKAIPVGADLSIVAPKFIVFVLEDVLKNAEPEGVKAINQTIALWQKIVLGKKVSPAAWSAAESAAMSAARSAAWSAARSAARSAAESAAWSAARSAARYAAMSAARYAARSAAMSAAWSAAESAAWSAAYGKYANKLISLLKSTK